MSVIEIILKDFPLGREEALHLIQTAPARYKVHEIEKRNDPGKRTIAQPTAEIKMLQRLMLKSYIENLPLSAAATAYRPGFGIKSHAQAHAKNNYLLKLDFKDFFPSISSRDLIKHLRKYSNVSVDDGKLLARLFFWRPKKERKLILSIGAPSSPSISNTLMYDFDSELIDFCKSNDIVYTRYADDIALSTNKPDTLKNAHDFIKKLCKRIDYPNLELNEEKTVYTSKKHHRELTGLVLSNDGKASIGREKKRLIRSMAHHYKVGSLPIEDYHKLRGLIAFTLSIDKKFVDTIKKMLGDEIYYRLIKLQD